MSNENKPQTDPNNKPQQVSTNVEPSVNIETQAQTSAAGGTAEDTLGEYKALIEQMKAQNDALLKQNQSLQNQFGILIRSGAHVGQHEDSNSVSGNDPDSVLGKGGGQTEPEEPYVSLAELGSQIGKRDYRSHNSQKE
jgi:hypothetical protein